MAAPQDKSEVGAAVFKGAIAEGVLMAIGAAIYVATGEVAWLVGGAIVGSAILLFLLAQAGAFTRR